MTRPQHPDYILDRFTRDTEHHQMTVLHDDGLYRHLHFQAPETSSYWFDLVTWPGKLAFTGSMDGYVFSRITDMFAFFREPVSYINPGYWAEKIVDGRERVEQYSMDVFKETVIEHVEQVADNYPAGLLAAVKAEVLGSDSDYNIEYEEDAREALNTFRFEGAAAGIVKGVEFRFTNTWEWNFRDWDWTYLWACHAIQWGIRQYDANHTAAPAPEPVGAAA